VGFMLDDVVLGRVIPIYLLYLVNFIHIMLPTHLFILYHRHYVLLAVHNLHKQQVSPTLTLQANFLVWAIFNSCSFKSIFFIKQRNPKQPSGFFLYALAVRCKVLG